MVRADVGRAGASRPATGAGLGPAERIRRRVEFQRVFDQGARAHGRFLTVVVLATGASVTRLGIAASGKLGNAVRRNRAKRLVREVFRRNKPAPGYDIVVIPRRDVFEAEFAKLEADYRATIGRRIRR